MLTVGFTPVEAGGRGSGALRTQDPAVRSILQGLEDFSSLEGLEERAGRDSYSLARLYYLLERLTRRRLLQLRFGEGEPAWARLTPAPPGWWDLPSALEASNHRLSRFAWLRRHPDGEVRLESARSRVVATLEPRAAAALLGCPPEGGGRPAGWTTLLALLEAERIVLPAGDGSETRPEPDSLLLWEFHDLLFHARSRMGLHSNPYGAVYPFPDVPPLPAVKPPLPADPVVSFPKPDLETLRSRDPSLTEVLESRRSLREYGDPPRSARLGEFLYRTARVRHRVAARKQELTSRPYPGGGACHPLEVYLAVRVCAELEPGLYHYCPERHALFTAGADPAQVQRLLEDARRAMGAPQPPQVLVVLAARLQRLSWKYGSMAYAAALKEVGVVFQTMYLVATAMKLAACAVGGGNIEAFSRATGLPIEKETSVGEFALGGLP